MSLPVLLAVLGAAFLHASWNAAIKTGGDKIAGMLLLTLGEAAVGAALVPFLPLPAAEAWPWIVASGVIHLAYMLLLAKAYEHGDLSRVYPIARGTAPLVVAAVGALVLPDRVSVTQYAGIVLLGGGILAMAHGVFRTGESRRLLPYALGSALATAGYSLVDGVGARIAGDALAYASWMMIVTAALYAPVVLAWRGPRLLAMRPRELRLGAFAAVTSFVAYATVIWAMTKAPIALVAALRETSILFAVLIGWLAFGDAMPRAKALAAGLIVAGVVLTRL